MWRPVIQIRMFNVPGAWLLKGHFCIRESKMEVENSMKEIRVSDVTMKSAGGSAGDLSFREKIALAKLLDRTGVSYIECEPIEKLRQDSLLLKSIAGVIREAGLAVPVKLLDKDSVEITWNALKAAHKARLQVTAPVSTVQMEYFYHLKEAGMLEAIAKAVTACRAFTEDVEFIASDAGRASEEFLIRCARCAREAGASQVTFSDTAGLLLPEEIGEFVRRMKTALGEGTEIGIHCSNELFMASTCSVSAIASGVDEVKTVAYGRSTASLLEVASVIRERGSAIGASSAIRVTELGRLMRQVAKIFETGRSATSPFEDGVREEDDFIMNEHDSLESVSRAVANLGYDLSEEDLDKVYARFKEIAARKKQVNARELDSIVATYAMQVPATYEIVDYVINSGNVISATSRIRLKKNGEIVDGVCVGDGPIDASFLAIEQITGSHYELDDFQIRAVTEGHEAMGETVVRLRSEGKLFSGRGISTDIIGSGIRAYINALNKIIYEESAV